MAKASLPKVTIIIPSRNEADFIERCIRSILDSDYPSDKMEVFVVDGMSTDATRSIVEQICEQDIRISLHDNERKIVPAALNIGIRKATGTVVIPVSAHAVVTKDFLRESVCQLQAHPEAWCVGGAVETTSTTYIGRSIAAAISSPVGVGNAMWRLGNYEGFVDTIAFGAYWRWVFDKVGIFDEELVRNQDDEFNFRMLQAGGKIYMSPRIMSQYCARSSLGKLQRQYFQYGFWRIRTLQKHKKPATFRQIVPLLFVLSLVLLLLLGLFWQAAWGLMGVELLLYFLGLLYGTLHVARKSNWRCALPAPVIFIILHFAYGVGSLWGFIRFVVFRAKGMQTPEQIRLSR